MLQWILGKGKCNGKNWLHIAQVRVSGGKFWMR